MIYRVKKSTERIKGEIAAKLLLLTSNNVYPFTIMNGMRIQGVNTGRRGKFQSWPFISFNARVFSPMTSREREMVQEEKEEKRQVNAGNAYVQTAKKAENCQTTVALLPCCECLCCGFLSL